MSTPLGDAPIQDRIYSELKGMIVPNWTLWLQRLSRYFGTPPNYTSFDADGTLVFNGNATVWADVYPSSVTVGVGGTAPNFTAYNGGNLKAYEFTGGVSNKEMQIGWQMYHSYSEGTVIVPHVHVTFTSGATDAGKTIMFDLEYEWTNVNGTGAYGTTTAQGSYTITANNTVYKNEIISFGNITGTGQNISSIFMTRLVRRQDSDSFGSSCWLMSADIHIELNTIGSRTELVK